MSIFHRSALVWVPLAVLVISSCTPRQAESTITIGVIAPLSGEFAPLGDAAVSGVKLAVEESDSRTALRLGGRRIRVAIRVEDDRGDPATARMALRKLAADGVAAIIGPLQPETARAAAADAGILLMVPAVSDPDLTASGPLVFRSCFDDRAAGKAMATYAYRHLGTRRAAILFDAATSYNTTLARSFASQFASLGGAVVIQESFTDERAIVEFRPALQRIITANPDVLFSPNYYRATAAAAVQARALGLRIPILSGEGIASPDFPLIGGDAVEGTALPVHFSLDDPRPATVRFRARFRATQQREPDAFAALAYDAIRLLLAAIGRAGSVESAGIRAALLQTRGFAGVTGTIAYAGSQTPHKDVTIARVRNGAFAFETVVSP